MHLYSDEMSCPIVFPTLIALIITGGRRPRAGLPLICKSRVHAFADMVSGEFK